MDESRFKAALWKMFDEFPNTDLEELSTKTGIPIDRLQAWMNVVGFCLETWRKAEAQQKIGELQEERRLDGFVHIFELAQEGYFDCIEYPGQEVNSVKRILFHAEVDHVRHEDTQVHSRAVSIDVDASLGEQVAATSKNATINELAVEALGRYYLRLHANRPDEFYLRRFKGASLKEVAETLPLSASGKKKGASAGAISRRVETLRKRFAHSLEKNWSMFVEFCREHGYSQPVVQYVSDIVGDS